MRQETMEFVYYIIAYTDLHDVLYNRMCLHVRYRGDSWCFEESSAGWAHSSKLLLWPMLGQTDA